jgi:hypothetical protein
MYTFLVLLVDNIITEKFINANGLGVNVQQTPNHKETTLYI